jgi:hypothetical protein
VTTTTGRLASRALAVLAVGPLVTLASAATADAHVAPDVTIVRPEAGADVSGTDLVVALSASTEGSGPAQFTLHLDDEPVDASGRVGPGGTFTGLSLAPGAQLQLTIPIVGPGEHSLEVRFADDGDHTKPTVVTGFTVGGSPSDSPSTEPTASGATPGEAPAAPGATVTPTGDTGVGPAFIETRAAAPGEGNRDGGGGGGGVVVAAVVVAAGVMTALLLRRRRSQRPS